MESEKLEAEREHLISEIERCQRAIEGGDSDPWWREDLGRFQHRLRCLDKPSAALTPPVDGGEFVMVPREPTEAMLDAGQDLWLGEDNRSPDWGSKLAETWSAMLAASPSRPSPSPEQREVVEAMRQAAIVVFQSEARKLAGSEAEFIAATESFIRGVDEAKAALCDRGE